ncbi:hypothetical protein GIB67_037930 [Kingdonia uniflora]|uniref:ETFB lysine methyltransferase n=1 Tax=Kingdonia uniflora TaxID=39325 RepID=A0A7J7LHA5_9MAGN|nr:hypothetical protein GIB67_037930 [Kingdonia uniflora]
MLSSLRVGHFFKHLSRTLISPSSSFTHTYKLFPIIPNLRENHSLIQTIVRRSSTSSDNWTDVSTAPYFSVRIRCRKDGADMLSDALLCFGASSASMDEKDSCESTDEIYISSIFTECQDIGTCISYAADSIGLKERPTYEITKDEQCDWIIKSQESFHPVEITEGLWIVPEWKTPPELKATNIILNPGLAFGTGEHPTTKLCLLLLRSLIKGDEFFLDYGTGSGILGIAALKFGAALSVGVDIDPNAIVCAHMNAALNNIEPGQMQFCVVPTNMVYTFKDGRAYADGDQSPDGLGVLTETEKYDVVIANILLNPLLELAENIIAYAKPGGIVGISGVLTEQLPQIEDRYSEYLEGISVSEIDGWACLSGIKKNTV